jgi:hypothetical protein
MFIKLYQDMQIRSGEERAALLNQLEQERSEKQILAVERERLINGLQFSTRMHEQELERIKGTIGWKVLNKYRETRQKSAVLRYLHFLLTEPVKRALKKIDMGRKAAQRSEKASVE